MGKSKSTTYPYGKRRRDEEGKKLAPRSIRKATDKHYLDQCTDYEIKEHTSHDASNIKGETKYESYSV